MKINGLKARQQGAETATGRGRARRRLRNAAIVLGASGALAVGAAGIAQASQVSTLGPGGNQSFSTYFFGRTEVCFQDVSQYDASYYWSSFTTNGGGGLIPGQQACVVRSFVGIAIGVTNLSPRASIQVTFPIGP